MTKNRQFDVEHALSMYAYSYYYLSAKGIYDDHVVAALGDAVEKCHIYMIGFVPLVQILSMAQEDRVLVASLASLGSMHELRIPMPDGVNLQQDDDGYFFVDSNVGKYSVDQNTLMYALHNKLNGLHFDTQYIGQAYGEDGSRNALHRLKKHETLQKISVQGIPDEHDLVVLLLEIQPANQIISVFSPTATEKDISEKRISQGSQKLFGTSEKERITLFEASLIRYFQPPYNKVFKNSFPSTNMKVLNDCYEKDFAAIVAEICFDDMPFNLCSETVNPTQYTIIKHDLHEDKHRRMFFLE